MHEDALCRRQTSRSSIPVPGTGKKTPGEPGTGKKTPGGAGTHTRHTEHADAQRHTDHTDETHNHRNPPTTHTPHVSATTEAAADSTATGPGPTAPRGRLRRGRPQRTRPCLHPLSQSASPRTCSNVESGRRNEGACGRRVAASSGQCGRSPRAPISSRRERRRRAYRYCTVYMYCTGKNKKRR